MAAPIIFISSDSSEESVGSHAPRVILFGTIPAIILVIPEVPIAPADPIAAPVDSLPIAPTSEFSLEPVVAPPEILRRPAILVRPGEAIPFGRPYRTHLNGPRKLLTARKRVGPFPARRLTWRRVPHRSSNRHSSPDFTSDSLMTSNNVYFIASFIPLIMEYLVNISKRRAFWSLNEDILKITILTTNTPYPSRKIR
ncbi:hypothetical protein Tco_0023876, partial [Tanacetum coccineum]